MKHKYQAFLQNRADRPKAAVQVNVESNEIFLYDEIGYWGITAQDFIQSLALTKRSERLTVCINSPGGDIFDGVTIANLLISRGDVDVRIDGFAASIASVIAMAGETVQMAENATFMIHNPWTFVGGDARELRKEAEVLDTLKVTLVGTYQRHTDLSSEEISTLMDDETWLNAAQALEQGFVTEVINKNEEASTSAKAFDLSIYRNAPERLRKTRKTEQPTNSGGGDSRELRRILFQLRHRTNKARSL